MTKYILFLALFGIFFWIISSHEKKTSKKRKIKIDKGAEKIDLPLMTMQIRSRYNPLNGLQHTDNPKFIIDKTGIFFMNLNKLDFKSYEDINSINATCFFWINKCTIYLNNEYGAIDLYMPSKEQLQITLEIFKKKNLTLGNRALKILT